MPNSPISAAGLNRNPQNIHIYSSGYAPAPFLTSNHFSIFLMASTKKKADIFFRIPISTVVSKSLGFFNKIMNIGVITFKKRVSISF